MTTLIIAIATAVLSLILTGVVRRHAQKAGILDVPNERSSHTVVTPRGGGVAIVVAGVGALLCLAMLGQIPFEACAALVAGGLAIATVGYFDDRRGVAARWRFLVHCVGAVICIALVRRLPHLSVFGSWEPWTWLVALALGIYSVWLVNLTNFMDGIDGLAGVESITTFLSGAWLAWIAGADPVSWQAPLVIAMATAGFLVWNWPPARIFMGDAGSGFLGFTFACLTIHAGGYDERLFWAWVILLAAFVSDATVTIIRRVLRGERIHQAHRSHAYQRLARRLGAHRPVTLIFAAVNAGWLLPIAYLVCRGNLNAAAGIALAYTPLVATAVLLGAGLPEPPSGSTVRNRG
jgi:Fuc2NAc and GlcNAc transferase